MFRFNDNIFKASKSNDTKAVSRFLSEGVDPNSKNKNGNTALHLAAKNGSKDAVQLLLERGADIQAKDKYGKTALDFAVASSSKDIVQLLLRRRDNKSQHKSTTLHSKDINKDMDQLLLDHGIDIGSAKPIGKNHTSTKVVKSSFEIEKEDLKDLNTALQSQGMEDIADILEALKNLDHDDKAQAKDVAQLMLDQGADKVEVTVEVDGKKTSYSAENKHGMKTPHFDKNSRNWDLEQNSTSMNTYKRKSSTRKQNKEHKVSLRQFLLIQYMFLIVLTFYLFYEAYNLLKLFF